MRRYCLSSSLQIESVTLRFLYSLQYQDLQNKDVTIFFSYASVKEILLRFKEIYIQIPQAQYCRKLFSYPLHTRSIKNPLLEAISHFAARRAGMDFHSNLTMCTIVEAVIGGGLVKDGTIIKQ
jgi:hypothetical protein